MGPGRAGAGGHAISRRGPGRVLGDHRSISFDSCGYGPLPVSAISGRVVLIGKGGSFTAVHTPRTFAAGGLAPPDHRPLVPPAPVSAAGAGALALLVLTVSGAGRTILRHRRRA